METGLMEFLIGVRIHLSMFGCVLLSHIGFRAKTMTHSVLIFSVDVKKMFYAF